MSSDSDEKGESAEGNEIELKALKAIQVLRAIQVQGQR